VWPTIIEGYVQAHEVMHFFDSAASMAFFVFAVKYVIQYRDTLPGEEFLAEHIDKQIEAEKQEPQTSEQVAQQTRG
jgi:hypothetical protein